MNRFSPIVSFPRQVFLEKDSSVLLQDACGKFDYDRGVVSYKSLQSVTNSVRRLHLRRISSSATN